MSTNRAATVEKSAQGDPGESRIGRVNTAAARSGYLPLPLEQVLVNALKGVPVYLHTNMDKKRFTLYCSAEQRFTDTHRQRLFDVGVRFIYIPMADHSRFQKQVEQELVAMAADPAVSTNTKSAIVYETSVELINEVLQEGGVAKCLPRLEQVAKSVSTLVVQDRQAFSHLFATAQHDFYTATHMVNVGTWMTSLAFAMGITDEATLSELCTAGMVHDVGKLFVPEEVLNKKGKLSDADWALLRSHPRRGEAHLRAQGITNDTILRVTLEHHERMDGSGYPDRKNGRDMLLASKICAVVDSFDAMTACRGFENQVKSILEAVQILRAEAGSKYEFSIVHSWVGMLSKAADQGMIYEPVLPPAERLGRRTEERFAIDCPARICELTRRGDGWEEGPIMIGKAHNISKSGLGLTLSRPISPSAYLRIFLNGSGTLENRVVEGQAMRCRAQGDGSFDLGLRLCTPGAQEAAASTIASQGDAPKTQ